jgi:hypothetical protein
MGFIERGFGRALAHFYCGSVTGVIVWQKLNYSKLKLIFNSWIKLYFLKNSTAFFGE